mmetsp:Transcript_14142/g.26602  ORF Transcript_14142/g.26602 Transcript_14142/m.26602 type:complete len:250 (-) Transcript_14142:34-783(-)
MVEHIINSQGYRLAGRRLILDPDSNEIFVICHGVFGSMDSEFIPSLAENLSHNSFRFDFAGEGLSEGEFIFGNITKQVDDLRVVVDYLRSQGFYVKGLIGHSKGANACLIYNSIYGGIDLTISISGEYYTQEISPFVMPRLEELKQKGFFEHQYLGRTYRYTIEDLKGKQNTDMQAVCQAFTGDAIIIHGDRDMLIRPSNAQAFASKLGAKCKRVFMIPKADHSYRKSTQPLLEAVNLSIESLSLRARL